MRFFLNNDLNSNSSNDNNNFFLNIFNKNDNGDKKIIAIIANNKNSD